MNTLNKDFDLFFTSLVDNSTAETSFAGLRVCSYQDRLTLTPTEPLPGAHGSTGRDFRKSFKFDRLFSNVLVFFKFWGEWARIVSGSFLFVEIVWREESMRRMSGLRVRVAPFSLARLSLGANKPERAKVTNITANNRPTSNLIVRNSVWFVLFFRVELDFLY